MVSVVSIISVEGSSAEFEGSEEGNEERIEERIEERTAGEGLDLDRR
jgi:hypothetical protein